MFSKFSRWKISRQGNRKHILLQLYNLNKFLFLSHPSLFVIVSFVCSLETFKLKSYFWNHDVSTSSFFVFNIKSYTFVLFLGIKTGYTNFDILVILYAIKYFRQKIKTEMQNRQLNLFLCFHVFDFKQFTLLCIINLYFLF